MDAHQPDSPVGVSASLVGQLTDRELQVLARRASGDSIAAIAAALTVEPRTVKFHLRNVYAKLGLTNYTHGARQIALARHAHLLEPDIVQQEGPVSRRYLFRPDRKLTQVLTHGAQGRFTLSAEVIPPRNGAEQAAVLDQVAQLVASGAQFLAVTKGAGGSLRGGSLPIAQAIKEQFGVPCIAHFTCRDLLPEEVENQLMDHHYFGIRNILALRGDPPDGQPGWQPTPGSHRYAHQLIAQISDLNCGVYRLRPNGPSVASQTPTDFCIGAAVYPEHPSPQERTDFFKRKVDAGAEYAITQMVFDPDAYGRFLDSCEKAGLDIPVLPGTRVLRSRTAARRTAEKYAVSIPDSTLRALPSLQDPDGSQRALDLFMPLVERLRHLGAPGIHLFVTDTATACAALSSLAQTAAAKV
ncbi:MAG TPA: methylenetetrahydrofolate reductase [Chloroflexota bacterium]|nr:methylenetetrahydrofolate reductase [Chloroflexota bacterium]